MYCYPLDNNSGKTILLQVLVKNPPKENVIDVESSRTIDKVDDTFS